MSDMKELKTIVRTESVARLVEALQNAGVSRLWVCHVHSLGAGVDPEDFRPSFEEGASYTEKAKLEFLAPADQVDDLIDVVREHAGTGHRGDGVVVVTDVADVVNVRTGDHDRLALL